MAGEYLEWKADKREKLYSCVLFDIIGVDRTSSDGRKGTFIEVKSKNWIVALPWFRRADGVPCFIMEEQFRHGSESVTREFPAGLVEEGEPFLEAAQRELLEETGISGDFTLLGNVNPNSAFMSNRQSFFLVENLKKVQSQDLDENEQIDVIEVPVEEVIRDMGTGLYDNGIMMMALGFFLRLAEKRPELREVKFLKKVFYVLLVVISVFALSSCVSTDKTPATVSVTGYAELALKPDVAIFTVSAESIEATSEEARAKTSLMVNQAVDILVSEFGVEEKDISTNYINISPYYTWQENERVLQGQRATQSIEVTLRKIDQYGDVFTSLSKIDGISVSTANLDKLDKSAEYREVRALAVKEAYDKAQSYAEASGMKIADVVSISDGSTGPTYRGSANLMMAKASDYVESASTEYYVGDISLSDSVMVVYSLKK